MPVGGLAALVRSLPFWSRNGPETFWLRPTSTLYSAPGAGRGVVVLPSREPHENSADCEAQVMTYIHERSETIREEFEVVLRALGLVSEATLCWFLVGTSEMGSRRALESLSARHRTRYHCTYGSGGLDIR